VRDSGLEDHEKVKLPTSDVGKEYMIEQIERDMANGTNIAGLAAPGELGGSGAGYGKAPGSATTALLDRLARKSPYYARNAPHLCSFFAKGTCNRGSACPYRHEMPSTGELAHQNIKDRYFGTNDPVAMKMMRRANGQLNDTTGGSGDEVKLKVPQHQLPPADQTITTIWVGGIDPAKDTELEVLYVLHRPSIVLYL
jgi:pre-mRNA-splicing factor RBM22/SLT11